MFSNHVQMLSTCRIWRVGTQNKVTMVSIKAGWAISTALTKTSDKYEIMAHAYHGILQKVRPHVKLELKPFQLNKLLPNMFSRT